MAKIPGVDSILQAADLISEVRKTFTRLDAIERTQRDLASAIERMDNRLREVEAGLREARAEIKLEAVKEAQSIINSVQSGLYSKIIDISAQVQNLSHRDPPGLPPAQRG